MACDPQNIIGKTVNAYISRPGPGKTRIIMMMFTDGSCCEFVSGKSQSFTRRASATKTRTMTDNEQLSDAFENNLESVKSPLQQMALSGF